MKKIGEVERIVDGKKRKCGVIYSEFSKSYRVMCPKCMMPRFLIFSPELIGRNPEIGECSLHFISAWPEK